MITMNTRIAIFLVAAIGLAACGGRIGTNVAGGEHANADQSKAQGPDHANMPGSPGAADAPYDLQFLDTMIAHHQGAIEMARLVGSRAQHDELRQLSRNMITRQQNEIDKMQGWRAKWYGDAPQAVNKLFPGMSEGMSRVNMAQLDQLKANAFDLEFVGQMIAHHEVSLAMAKDALDKGSNEEIKAMARRIIETQEAEIAKMKQWKDAWK